jgi:toxin YoeB
VKLSVTSVALADLETRAASNPKVLARIIRLVAEAMQTPRSGTGKPERLKHLGGEIWSRRITERDRLVYDIQDDAVVIIACRFYYDDH